MAGKLLIADKISADATKRYAVGVHSDPIRLHGIHPEPGILNFGVEIEMGFDNRPWERDYARNPRRNSYLDDSSYYGQSLQDIYDRVEGYCALKHDCGAIEIVSVPLNYDEIRLYLKTLLDGPMYRQRGPRPSEWGMHIHVSNIMSSQVLKRMLKFMLDKEGDKPDFMDFIAGRPTNNRDSANDDYDVFDEEDGLYGSGWGYLPPYLDFRRSVRSSRDDRDAWLMRSSDRFGIAINTYHNTHEFRLFGTTNDPNRACANVEFVKALIDYSTETRVDEGLLEVDNFVEFVHDNNDEYPDLDARIQASTFA